IGDRLHTWVKSAKRSNFKIPNQLRSGVVEPNEAAVRTLIEYVVKNSIDVVSIDPLRRTHRVNENDNVAMGEVIELYEQVAEEANCAVHLWHHFRKGNGSAATLESVRGAIAIVDAPRLVRLVEKMSKDDSDGFGVDPERRGFYFKSFNGKLTFVPPVHQMSWFELKSVTLDNAWPFGDDMGVATAWQPPDTRELTLSPEQVSKIREEVGIRPRYRLDVRASKWAGQAIAQALKLGQISKADKEVLKGLLDKLLKTGVLKTVVAVDEKRREEFTFVVVV